MVYLLLQIIHGQTCDIHQFSLFQKEFEKNYLSVEEEQGAYKNFCQNSQFYSDNLQILNSNNVISYGLTSLLDMNLDEFYYQNIIDQNKIRKLSNNFFQKQDCQQYICAVQFNDFIPKYARFHKSIDLREVNLTTNAKQQFKCGSCWAFVVNSILETNILKDQKYLRKYNKFWTFSNKNLSLSEQFLMNNAYGNNNFCEGGDFTTALDYMVYHFDTVELTENYPYCPTQKLLQLHQNNVLLKTFINDLDKFLPFSVFQQNDHLIASVQIFTNDQQKFGKETAKQIKQALSRGMAVAAQMIVNKSDKSIFFYKGEDILHAKCQYDEKFHLYHAVTFIGYGMKNGKEVWIMKNSWGKKWGSGGAFYVEIGQNSFCTEQYAFTAFSYYFNKKDPIILNSKELRGKVLYLDKDNNIFVFYSIITVMIIGIVVTIHFFTKKYNKVKIKRIQLLHYQ